MSRKISVYASGSKKQPKHKKKKKTREASRAKQPAADDDWNASFDQPTDTPQTPVNIPSSVAQTSNPSPRATSQTPSPSDLFAPLPVVAATDSALADSFFLGAPPGDAVAPSKHKKKKKHRKQSSDTAPTQQPSVADPFDAVDLFSTPVPTAVTPAPVQPQSTPVEAADDDWDPFAALANR